MSLSEKVRHEIDCRVRENLKKQKALLSQEEIAYIVDDKLHRLAIKLIVSHLPDLC